MAWKMPSSSKPGIRWNGIPQSPGFLITLLQRIYTPEPYSRCSLQASLGLQGSLFTESAEAAWAG